MVVTMQILLILVALAQAAGMVAVFIRNYRRVPTGIYDDGTDNTYTSQADDNDSAVFRSAAPVHTNLAETVQPTLTAQPQVAAQPETTAQLETTAQREAVKQFAAPSGHAIVAPPVHTGAPIDVTTKISYARTNTHPVTTATRESNTYD